MMSNTASLYTAKHYFMIFSLQVKNLKEKFWSLPPTPMFKFLSEHQLQNVGQLLLFSGCRELTHYGGSQ